jgi:hypothetical protein
MESIGRKARQIEAAVDGDLDRLALELYEMLDTMEQTVNTPADEIAEIAEALSTIASGRIACTFCGMGTEGDDCDSCREPVCLDCSLSMSEPRTYNHPGAEWSVCKECVSGSHYYRKAAQAKWGPERD